MRESRVAAGMMTIEPLRADLMIVGSQAKYLLATERYAIRIIRKSYVLVDFVCLANCRA